MDPDFKNIKHWIFDLDNTLYNENDSGLGDQFVTNINIFMVEKMGLPAPRANELMLELYEKYGSSYVGLIEIGAMSHEEDSKRFEEIVFDELDFSKIIKNDDLDKALSKLPGEKIILTSSPEVYAERVLKRLGVEKHFSSIWGLHKSYPHFKPKEEAFLKVVETEGFSVENTAFVDDCFNHIKAAKKLGLKTVWIDSNESDISSIDMSVVDVHTADIVRTIKELGDL